MPTPRKVSGTVTSGGHPMNNIAVSAYLASRVGSPTEGQNVPTGAADAGPVNTGPAFGGEGAYSLTLPDAVQDYYLHALVASVHTWQLIGGLATMPGGGSAGQGLRKVNGTDFNAEWGAVGGGVVSSITEVVAAVARRMPVATQSLPPGTFRPGSTYRLRAFGTCTSTNADVSHFWVRFGDAFGGTILIDVAVTSAVGTAAFAFDAIFTVLTNGTSGTAIGSGTLLNSGVVGVADTPVTIVQGAAVSIDTTQWNTIGVTYSSAAATTTCTFENATIELIA